MLNNLPMDFESKLYKRKWMVIAFLVFGILFIAIADILFLNFIRNDDLIIQLQFIKEILLVISSGMFIYGLLYFRDQHIDQTTQFINSIIETAEVGLSVTDSEGTYTLVNQSFCDLMGYDREELLDEPFTKILNQDQKKEAMLAYQQYMQHDKPLISNWEVVTKSGKKRHILLSYNKFTTHRNKQYQVASLTDTTRLLKTSKELEQAYQTLSLIIDTAPVGIIKLNNSGCITDLYNTTAERILGWKKEEIIGLSLPAIDRLTQQNLKKMYESVLQGQQLQGVEIDFLHKEGNPLKLSISAARLDRDNNDDEIIITLTDITEKNRVQDEIEQSYKENKILLQEIHHRVKNNLAIISGILQLQIDELDDPSSASILYTTHNRIQSIASVHERLYGSSSLMRIELDEHLHALITQAKSNLSAYNLVEFDLCTDNVKLNINQAIPFGLLMNEYFTHAINLADEKQEKLQIDLKIKSKGHLLQVNFSSSANDPSVDITSWTSLSRELIESLLQQLNADYTFDPQGISNFRFTFPITSL